VEGQWNPNPCTDLDEILHTYLHRSKEGFGEGLSLPTPPSGPGVPKILKADGDIFENFL